MRVEVGRIVGDGGGEGAADSEGQELSHTQFCMSVDRWSLLPFSEAID